MEKLIEVTKELDSLKVQKARLKFDLNEIEKEIEKKEFELISFLARKKVDSMDLGIYTFGFKKVLRTAFDQKLFQEDNPELFEKYKITKENEKFEFKINK